MCIWFDESGSSYIDNEHRIDDASQQSWYILHIWWCVGMVCTDTSWVIVKELCTTKADSHMILDLSDNIWTAICSIRFKWIDLQWMDS